MPFPSLIPSSRVWTPGAAPVDAAAAGTGSEARVNASDLVEGSQLRLTFIGIAEGDWLALDAFAGEVGIGWQPFSLPASIWGGVSNQAHYLPAGYGWMFAEPPDIDDLPCGGHGAAVVLTAVPLAAAVAQGAQLTVTASIRTLLPVRAPGAALVAQALVRGGGATPVPVRAPGAALMAVASIAGGGASNISDPTFNNVELLLHMNGSNGSTTFTDNSSNAFTVTANGNAQISTTRSKYGNASAYFDGDGDYLSIADDAALEFGSGDFTVEFWLYVPTDASNSKGIANKGTWPSNASSFLFYYGGGNELAFYASSDGVSWNIVSDGRFQNTLTKGVWQHIAVSRSGNTIRGFLDGVKKFEVTSSAALHNNSSPLVIGSGNGGSEGIKANIDELRIKSEAVYTIDFTPTGPFPDF